MIDTDSDCRLSALTACSLTSMWRAQPVETEVMTAARGITMTDSSEVLDIERIEALVDEIGDRVLVREALQTFVDEVPGRLDAIGEAVGGGDGPVIKAATHALGSPAAMLGAVGVRGATRAMNEAATEGRTEHYPALQAEIETVTAQTVVEIRAYLAAATA
jgi:HPt (histidine-containing phosphotransfer) domain-containing protein